VTITGSRLAGATSVSFNGVPASFAIVSDSQLTAQVPASATSGTIRVTTPSGTAASASSLTILAAPTISWFSPSGGKAGTYVTISGTHLSGTTSVTFNGVAANFTNGSDSQLYAQIPVSATSGPIVVTTPAGTATSASSYTVAPGGGGVGGTTNR
jgi:hypothetical protein